MVHLILECGIEYEGAFHHVMNRGRDNQTICLEDKARLSFLCHPQLTNLSTTMFN